MKNRPVIFFTLNDYDNLGVGYMASVLSGAGFETEIIDPREEKTIILDNLKAQNPLLVGFSIIFHNYIDLFSELIDYLREEGIDCHFTAGGHYASLRYNELFQLVPKLDSIVRFEGEYPILELAKCLKKGEKWKKIKGLVYKKNNDFIVNPVLPLERDLDKFPYPERLPLKTYAFNKKFTTILSGRGCIHNCSFCNTRVFYRQAQGPLKRIRKPEAVVDEMEYLFHSHQCSVFLFHDDDFPVKSSGGRDWVDKFCTELENRNLKKKITWKINCRPDDVEEEIFLRMRENGLFLVFLGIEDGTDKGLKKLNKNMTIEKCLKGINILKKLEIGFDYGFMLFQPDTTFNKLNRNIEFLRQLCEDGYTPVTFLKLLPLYETRVERELKKTGRLRYLNGMGDYDFIEESMNRYFRFIMDGLAKWLWDPYGFENISKWIRNYFLVYIHYFGNNKEIMDLNNKFRKNISESNMFLLDTMKELSKIFESGDYLTQKDKLGTYIMNINSNHNSYKRAIFNINDQLLKYEQENR